MYFSLPYSEHAGALAVTDNQNIKSIWFSINFAFSILNKWLKQILYMPGFIVF
jgi:hypothetical protein